MKINKLLFAAAFAALLSLSACSEDSPEPPTENDNQENTEEPSEQNPIEEPEMPSEPDPVEDNIPKEDGVLVTEGHVDLGLSVEWAACNLGSEWCWEKGVSYGFGYTKADCPESICGTEYDIATHNLGSEWRLPTKEQMLELAEKCRWNPTKYRGVLGIIITGPSGKAIFIPTNNKYSWSSEDYWTGTLDLYSNDGIYMAIYNKYDSQNKWYVNGYCGFSTKERSPWDGYYKCYVRPVYSEKW